MATNQNRLYCHKLHEKFTSAAREHAALTAATTVSSEKLAKIEENVGAISRNLEMMSKEEKPSLDDELLRRLCELLVESVTRDINNGKLKLESTKHLSPTPDPIYAGWLKYSAVSPVKFYRDKTFCKIISTPVGMVILRVYSMSANPP